MDLTNKETLSTILSRHHLWAQKRMGQNFLVNNQVLATIIETARLSKKDYIIEVGSGVGTLTKRLCQKARWVLGVEIDQKMIKILKETCGSYLNLKIVQKNILGLEIEKVIGQNQDYKVVANLPYYITQPVLRYFLENRLRPELMVLMVQKEVAEKITAKPGKMSLLSVAVQFYADPFFIEEVQADSFFPKPKVNSAIIKIANIKPKFPIDTKLFFQIAKAGFSAKRKQLKNALAGGLHLPEVKILKIFKKAKINFQRRAQELSLGEWHELYQTYTKFRKASIQRFRKAPISR